jgi:hypothetical protein
MRTFEASSFVETAASPVPFVGTAGEQLPRSGLIRPQENRFFCFISEVCKNNKMIPLLC